jgi:hypothetical protein
LVILDAFTIFLEDFADLAGLTGRFFAGLLTVFLDFAAVLDTARFTTFLLFFEEGAAAGRTFFARWVLAFTLRDTRFVAVFLLTGMVHLI